MSTFVWFLVAQINIVNSAAAAKSLQSYPTLFDPIDGSPPGSAVPGILQARTLEWVAIAFPIAWKWKVKVKSLSHVRLLATPWTAAYQAPPSMGFSRQEYWSGVPLPSPQSVLTTIIGSFFIVLFGLLEILLDLWYCLLLYEKYNLLALCLNSNLVGYKILVIPLKRVSFKKGYILYILKKKNIFFSLKTELGNVEKSVFNRIQTSPHYLTQHHKSNPNKSL